MTMTMLSLSALTAGLLLSGCSHAFTPASTMQKAALASKVQASQHKPQLQQQRFFMAKTDGDKETAEPYFVKSVLKKQMAYDEKAGRFFESNVSEEDCIPDEEFCVTDKETGDYIRLTQPEKERIFLDSLQVGSKRFSSCLRRKIGGTCLYVLHTIPGAHAGLLISF
jgi:hypothetical protein